MDPNKPFDSQGSQTTQNPGAPSLSAQAGQLSPQIKIPPSSPPTPANVPPNLPTGPSRPSIPTPSPVRPPSPPVPPQPPAVPAPGGVQAGPPAVQAGQPVFKSSIRTMQEDIAAIKRGQPPAGFKIEKESEKEIKQPVSPITPPPSRTIPAPRVELGRPEKSRLLPGTPSLGIPRLVMPPISSKEPGKEAISVPTPKFAFLGKLGGGKHLNLILIVLILIVGLALAFIFLRSAGPEITATPTPRLTTTLSPSPSAVSLEQLFSVFSSVNLAGGTDFFTRLEAQINKSDLAGGEPGLYKITDPQNNQEHTLSGFLLSAQVTLPQAVASYVDGLYVSLKLKADGSYGSGIIAKIQNIAGLDSALKGWEASISTDLDQIFGLDVSKAATVEFLNNTYQGLTIKFRNFPDPNKTIDYAIITVSNGDNYLVLTNSREHIYSLIDKMK